MSTAAELLFPGQLALDEHPHGHEVRSPDTGPPGDGNDQVRCPHGRALGQFEASCRPARERKRRK